MIVLEEMQMKVFDLESKINQYTNGQKGKG